MKAGNLEKVPRGHMETGPQALHTPPSLLGNWSFFFDPSKGFLWHNSHRQRFRFFFYHYTPSVPKAPRPASRSSLAMGIFSLFLRSPPWIPNADLSLWSAWLMDIDFLSWRLGLVFLLSEIRCLPGSENRRWVMNYDSETLISKICSTFATMDFSERTGFAVGLVGLRLSWSEFMGKFQPC